MADIITKVEAIRAAEYGRQVRESIASGIEAINAEVVSTTARQGTVEERQNAVEIRQDEIDTSEATRITNETNRSTSEDIRVAEFDGIKTDYDTYKGVMIAESNVAALQNNININSAALENNVQQLALKAKQSDLVITNTNIEAINTQISFVTKHIQNYANFLKKINNSSNVKIVCQGDSLTYGADNVSTDKRVTMSDTTLDTTYVQNMPQASKTYPEMLRDSLAKSYNGVVTVLNRGYCGDTAQLSYGRWAVNPNADITFLMLGTNDMMTSIDVQTYLTYMSKIIEQLITWGSVVVLLTVPKCNVDIETGIVMYRNTLMELHKKYGVEVVDSSKFTNDYFNDIIHIDTAHFNGKGYTIIGSKVASKFIELTNKYNKNVLRNNTIVCVSKTQYPSVLKGAVSFLELANSKLGVLNSNANGAAIYIPAGSAYTIEFETKENDLVVTPMYLCVNANCIFKFTLDYGIDIAAQATKQFYTLDNQKNTFTKAGLAGNYDKTTYPYTNVKLESFVIPNKGIHSVLMESTGTESACYFMGLVAKRFSEITI